MADAHERTLAHLRLLASLPGFRELRAFWIVATATPDGLLSQSNN